MIDGTPVIGVVLENPLLSTGYPANGYVLAVFDTEYEGFAVIPEDIFKKLRLNELSLYRRSMILPNGKLVESVGTYGIVTIPELNTFRDGFIETSKDRARSRICQGV